MVNLEFFGHFLNLRIQKMSPLVTHKNFGHPKLRNDVLKHECGGMLHCVVLDHFGLRPLGEVFGGNHNVSHSF